MSANGKPVFTITGPGYESASELPGGALLRAQRAAELSPEPATFYVRNGGTEALWQVERTDSGDVLTHTVGGSLHAGS